LVAEREGAVVGFAYAGKHSQRAAYRWTVDVTVYVRDGERRTGAGRQLYQVLLGILRLQGFRSAFAEIVLPNPGSVRLHEAMGFRHVGIHNDIGHKLGRWHDIGYWRLGLGDGPEPPSEPVPFAALMRTPAFDDVLKQLKLEGPEPSYGSKSTFERVSSVHTTRAEVKCKSLRMSLHAPYRTSRRFSRGGMRHDNSVSKRLSLSRLDGLPAACEGELDEPLKQWKSRIRRPRRESAHSGNPLSKGAINHALAPQMAH
jgi:hypothetical protein